MAGTRGDATTATADQIAAQLNNGTNGGLYLGRHCDLDAPKATTEIRYKGDRHALVFGPTGSGKTKRFLVPNLLLGLDKDSAIVIDPKGELASMTAKHRLSLGHKVVILNPFNVLGMGSAGYNPLDIVDPDAPTFYDDAAAIGEALIKIEGSEPHWSESAQGLLTALVMWEKKQHGKQASLENVRAMLTEANKWVTAVNNEGREYQRQVAGLRCTAAKMVADGGYQIASLAGRFTNDTDEIASIQSTADTQTRWLLSEPMRADVQKSGVDFASLKSTPTTVYVVLPAERLRTHSVWLRLVIVSALRALYTPKAKGGKRKSLRTVMMIDEMAALGHLPPLEDAFGLVRGFGIQIVAILQDLPQLKGLYKERWETFVANAGVVFGFAPNDLTTSDWMSKRAGQTTVVAKSTSATAGTSSGGQTSMSSGMSTSDQQVARPLFFPHELMGLAEGRSLLWLASFNKTTPIFAPYYKQIKACRERALPSPYDDN